jgi:hypothetical protein
MYFWSRIYFDLQIKFSHLSTSKACIVQLLAKQRELKMISVYVC